MQAIEEFKEIQSDSQLQLFIKRYGFVEDTRQTLAHFLGVYRGRVTVPQRALLIDDTTQVVLSRTSPTSTNPSWK